MGRTLDYAPANLRDGDSGTLKGGCAVAMSVAGALFAVYASASSLVPPHARAQRVGFALTSWEGEARAEPRPPADAERGWAGASPSL